MAEIKNLKKAAARISKAIKKGENIIIYGDADLDGVTSVIILEETIKNLGGKVADLYFPDREEEGHGVTNDGLKYLKKHTPALLISLDCGIGNLEEIKEANKLGFEVIIIDHHQPLDKVPDASIIVDPKQKGDKYPFKEFANVGITFKLVEVLLKKKMTENLRKSFLELTALATIADMMPREDENEKMIVEGLASLESSWRPGLQALVKLEELNGLNFMDRIYKINSYLNVRDVKDRMPAAFRLLTSSTEEEAKRLAIQLAEKGALKRKRVREIKEDIVDKLGYNPIGSLIFEGNSDWELILLGIVASLLVREYDRPVFLHIKQKDHSQGAVRAPSGYNVVDAMATCSKYLETFGGHPKAAGFRVKNDNIEKFEECLSDYFDKFKK